ncbi:hypothetical protein FJZ31_28555 [Candidatus Poribacteria bacterium]|nr:hypothetical protein [Candidatus Poribacteria bacterium]
MNNIQSFKFFALFALAIALFGINAFVSSKEYERELTAYSKRITQHSQYDSNIVFVDKRPNPLSFVIEGQSRKQDKTLIIEHTGNIAPAGIVYRENFLLQDFEVIDWAFIIKLLFSIFAILLTFDAICGEKEKGTLALVCSNSVPRGNIILGKYLGAISTLIVPLFVGMLINIIIINFQGKINLNALMTARIGLTVLVGLIYLSVFVFLGLFISSITHRTPTSLLLNLNVWLILVVVIPTLAGMAGENFSKASTESQFLEREEEIYEMWRNPTYGQKLLQDIVSKKRLTEVEEIQEEAIKLLIEATNEKIKLNQDMWHAVEAKENLARNIACISPSATFQFGGESLAFTGIVAERSFYKAAQNFATVYRDYIQEKTGVAYKFDWSVHPWQIDVRGKIISISAPRQPGFPKGLKDLPQFNEPYPSILDSFKHGFINVILLTLWDLLLFFLSNLFFIRYDVR